MRDNPLGELSQSQRRLGGNEIVETQLPRLFGPDFDAPSGFMNSTD